MSEDLRMPFPPRSSAARNTDVPVHHEGENLPRIATQTPQEYPGYAFRTMAHPTYDDRQVFHPVHDTYRHGPTAPMSEAFMPVRQPLGAYQAPANPPPPIAGPSNGTAGPIDPALVELPRGPDPELVARPAKKVSGVRQGKQRGRPAGSGNYASEDVLMLLNFVQEELPLGARGWKILTKRFNKWAKRANRPKRAQKSLETKFKQLLRQRKPTGSGYRPPEVERAYEIEQEINERAGNRAINDSEHGGSESEPEDDGATVAEPEADGSSSDSDASEKSDDQGGEKPSKTPAPPRAASKVQRVAKAVRAPSPAGPGNRRVGRSAAGNAGLVANVAQAFDPQALRTRDAERDERLSSTTQVLTMSNQIRDLQSQLFRMQERLHESERARDRAEMRLEFSGLGMKTNANPMQIPAPVAFFDGNTPQPNYNPSKAGRRKRFVRQETKYPGEDGGFTYFDTDGSETDSDYEREHLRKRRRTRAEDREGRGKRRRHNHDHSRARSRSPGPSTSHHRHPGALTAAAGNGVEVSVTPGRTPRISFLVNSPAKPSTTQEQDITVGDKMHVDE